MQDSLVSLIKGLSKSEKRSVRQFLSRHTQLGENNLLRLYEICLDLTGNDAANLKAAAQETRFAGNLSETKYQLERQVMKCLRVLYADSFPGSRVRHLLTDIEILYYKALFTHCKTKLRKARQILATAQSEFELLEVIGWEKRLITFGFLSHDELGDLQQEEEQTYRRLETYSRLSNLEQAGAQFFKRHRFVRNRSELEELEQLLGDPLKDFQPDEMTLRWRMRFYRLKTRYAWCKLAGLEAESYQRQVLELIEANPQLAAEEQTMHIVSLYDHAFISTFNHQHDQAAESMRKLESLKPVTPRHELFHFLAHYGLQLNMHEYHGRFEQALELREPILAGLDHYGSNVPPQQRARLNFNLAHASFGMGNYSDTLDYTNEVRRVLAEKDNDFLPSVRILEVLVHFELGNNQLLPYLLKSVYRALQKQKRIYRFERIMMNFLSRSIRNPAEAGSRSNLRRLLNQLHPLLQSPYDRMVVDYFGITAWLESKVTGRSFSECARDKVLRKLPFKTHEQIDAEEVAA